MVRQIIRPEKNRYVLNLPDNMVGKTVEVIEFDIGQTEESEKDLQ